MRDAAAEMRTWDQLHAAILRQRRIQRDPHPRDMAGIGDAEIGGILVPWLFRADARRLHQRHLLHQQAALAENGVEQPVQPPAHRSFPQHRRVVDEIHVFADAQHPLLRRQCLRIGPRLIHQHRLAAGNGTGCQSVERLDAGCHVLAAEQVAHHHIAVATVMFDLLHGRSILVHLRHIVHGSLRCCIHQPFTAPAVRPEAY